MRVITFIMATFFLIIPLNAQTIQATDIVFSPPLYYMGDLVTLQFKLKGTTDQQLHLPVYEKNDKIQIERINFASKDNSTLVTVKFRAYTVESSSLNFNFGTVTVENIGYSASSLLEENGRELRNSYGPHLLIGTRLMIVTFLMLLILLPPLSYFAIVGIKRIINRIKGYIKSPYRKFKTEMSRLYTETTLSDKEFYFRLFTNFRELLSEVSNLKEYRSATEQQLGQLLKIFFNDEQTDSILNLYRAADRIKFGGKQADKGQRIKDIDLITRLGQIVYQIGVTNNASV